MSNIRRRPGFLSSVVVMFCGGVTAVFSSVFFVLAAAHKHDEGGFVYPDQSFHHDPEFNRRNQEINHFQHDPNFHRNHPKLPNPTGFDRNQPGSPNPINFDDQSDLMSRSAVGAISDNTTMEIPLDFALDLSKYDDHNLILMKFVEGGEDHLDKKILHGSVFDVAPDDIVLRDRFGGNSERDSAEIPKSAQCMPELQTVKIAQSDNPSVLYIPQCTRIMRCGGCCSHPLLSCQANQTENVTFKVTKTEYVGGSKLKYVGKELVVVERHTKCKCGCKVKETDCDLRIQEYLGAQCKCVCKNLDEEKKCYKQMPKKLWNPESCTCQCRDVMPCSYGYQFDYNECRCVQANVKRRYILREPSPVEPSGEEN